MCARHVFFTINLLTRSMIQDFQWSNYALLFSMPGLLAYGCIPSTQSFTCGPSRPLLPSSSLFLPVTLLLLLSPSLSSPIARWYACAVLAMALCLSVCLSVTNRCSTKMAKRRITQTTLHDSTGTLVFWCQRSRWNSTGVTPYRGAKCRWGGSKSATFDK